MTVSLAVTFDVWSRVAPHCDCHPTEETVCLPCITSVERTTRSGIVPPVRQGGGSTTPSSSTRNHRKRRRRAFDTVVMPVALSARGIRREGAIAQIDFDKPGGRAYLDGLAVQGTTNELDKRHSLDSLGSAHQRHELSTYDCSASNSESTSLGNPLRFPRLSPSRS